MFFVLPVDSRVKVSVMNRVVAKVIDLVLVVAMAAILRYPLGPLCGFLYSIFADGLPIKAMQGQSIGKKLMRLRAVRHGTLTPVNLKESVFRNAPVGVVTFFAIIPVWGWLILVLIGVPLMIMEIYLMLSVETGQRLGDVMGDTDVIEVHRPPFA